MDSDRQLKRWYAKFNGLWFGGALPVDTVIYWKPLSENVGQLCPIFEIADGKFEINIDPRYSGTTWEWKLVLLHEMAHLKLWRKNPRHQHGKIFQEEMQRLALAGAFRGIW